MQLVGTRFRGRKDRSRASSEFRVGAVGHRFEFLETLEAELDRDSAVVVFFVVDAIHHHAEVVSIATADGDIVIPAA